MKKMCAWMASMLLAVCLVLSSAMAADVTLMSGIADSEDYVYISQVEIAGDTAYGFVRLDENEARIYAWNENQQDAELWAEGLLYIGYFDQLKDVESWLENSNRDASMAKKGISWLFSDGERLMGLNHLTGEIFTMAAENGALKTELLTTIQDTSFFYHVEDDYSYVIMPQTVVAAGGKMLWYYCDWDNAAGTDIYRIMSVDLKDGSVRQASVEHPAAITRGKDGKLLVLSRDPEDAYDSQKKQYKPYAVLAYDPISDKAEKLGELQTDRWLYTIAYSEELDALLWQQDTRIMGLKNFKEEMQLAYIPTSSSNTLAALGKHVLTGGNGSEGVFVREMQENFSTDKSLNILNGYMDDAARAFADKYPQVPVYSVNGDCSDAEMLSLTMNAGQDAPDVLTMGVAYSPFDTLKDKGYCADLSAYPALKEFADQLYPVYREALSGDKGEIWAVPMNAYSYDGYFINRYVMEEMGLTVEDIPTNFVELCEFATRWNDEFVDQYPDFALLEYTEHYKERIFRMMVEGWAAYCEAKDMALKYDDPIFREMIAALEKMEVKELDASMKRTDPEKSEYKQALIWSNASVVGSWADFTKEDSDRIYIPMTLTKDTEDIEGVYLSIAFINPKSQNKELAAEYLAYQLEALSATEKAVLLTTHAKPVERENYQTLVEEAQKNLEGLEKGLAESKDEEKKDWEALVAEQKAYMARLPERRWRISEAAIRSYVDVVLPGVYIRTPNLFDYGQQGEAVDMESLVSRYTAGQISIDQFIRELDGKLRMMQMEDY